MIKLASLGSGSKGNATLIVAGPTSLLIDNGFTTKESISRAERLGFDLSSLSGILVTHEHSDHINGVARLARKFGTPVYTSVGSWHAKDQGQVPKVNYICSHSSFNVGDIEVTPISVPHDAREPLQFVFEHAGVRFGLLTDLGTISPYVEKEMSSLDALLIEFNHCREMLMRGAYPPALKKRVAGDYGHLNNEQALAFVNQLDLNRLGLLIAGHLSQQNNCTKKVELMLSPIKPLVERIIIAEQDKGFGWVCIGSKGHALAS